MRVPCERFSNWFLFAALAVATVVSWACFLRGEPNAHRADDQRPRIIAVHPADGDAGVEPDTDLRIRFDRAMVPTLAVLEWAPRGEAGFRLRGPMRYQADTHEFTLPLRLMPGRKHDVTLNREGITPEDPFEGFQAVDGLAAAPFRLSFTTAQTKPTTAGSAPGTVPMSPASASEVALFTPVEATFDRPVDPSKSARFRTLVDRIREASRKVSSVSENVLITYTFRTLPDWHDRYWSQGAKFKMAGNKKFVAVVDQIMHIPFRVGSDGTTCWFVGKDRRIELAFVAIDEKNLLFADPFDARGSGDAEAMIRDRKLDYYGEVDLNGRRCHLIRSWDIKSPSNLDVIPALRWYIDAVTLLAVRVEQGESYAVDFTYTGINQPIPDEEFRPSGGAEFRFADPEPLPEGYNRRFLNVIDGTNGRMSVRWGMKGPKGTNSGGLN